MEISSKEKAGSVSARSHTRHEDDHEYLKILGGQMTSTPSLSCRPLDTIRTICRRTNQINEELQIESKISSSLTALRRFLSAALRDSLSAWGAVYSILCSHSVLIVRVVLYILKPCLFLFKPADSQALRQALNRLASSPRAKHTCADISFNRCLSQFKLKVSRFVCRKYRKIE